MRKLYFLVMFCLIMVINKFPANAQNIPDDSIISCYLHVSEAFEPDYKIVNFTLNSVDSLSKEIWRSKKITPLLKDSIGYLIKVDFPKSLFPPSNMIHCTALAVDPSQPADTMKLSY